MPVGSKIVPCHYGRSEMGPRAARQSPLVISERRRSMCFPQRLSAGKAAEVSQGANTKNVWLHHSQAAAASTRMRAKGSY